MKHYFAFRLAKIYKNENGSELGEEEVELCSGPEDLRLPRKVEVRERSLTRRLRRSRWRGDNEARRGQGGPERELLWVRRCPLGSKATERASQMRTEN